MEGTTGGRTPETLTSQNANTSVSPKINIYHHIEGWDLNPDVLDHLTRDLPTTLILSYTNLITHRALQTLVQRRPP